MTKKVILWSSLFSILIFLTIKYFTVQEVDIKEKEQVQKKIVFFDKTKAKEKLTQKTIKSFYQKEKSLEKEFFSSTHIINDKKVRVSHKLRAIPKDRYIETLGKKVKTYSGFIFYEVAPLRENKLLIFDQKSMPVLLDPNTGLFKVLSGHIYVKAENENAIQKLSNRDHFDVFYTGSHLNLYGLKIKQGHNIHDEVEIIKESEFVSEVETEVLERAAEVK